MPMTRKTFLAFMANLAPLACLGAAQAGGTSPDSDGGIVSDDDGQVVGDDGGTSRLTGRVMTYEGWAIAGAAVTVQSLDDEPRAIPDIGVLSGADGSYVWELPAGTYRVTVVSPAGHKKSRTAALYGGRMRTLNFWLPK